MTIKILGAWLYGYPVNSEPNVISTRQEAQELNIAAIFDHAKELDKIMDDG